MAARRTRFVCIQLVPIRGAEGGGEEPPFRDDDPGGERNVLLPAKPRAMCVPLKAAEDAAWTGVPLLPHEAPPVLFTTPLPSEPTSKAESCVPVSVGMLKV